MRRSVIIVLGVMLVIIMVWGSGGALSSPGSEENKGLSYLHPSAPAEAPLPKVLEATAELRSAGVASLPGFAGIYVDDRTDTVHIGFTRIEGENTEFVEAIVSHAEGVNVEFFEAQFTMIELGSMESRLYSLFAPGYGLRAADVPFSGAGVYVQINGLFVSLTEVTPEYIAAIRDVVGEEVPISFFGVDPYS